jgi:hypothetical protein
VANEGMALDVIAGHDLVAETSYDPPNSSFERRDHGLDEKIVQIRAHR